MRKSLFLMLMFIQFISLKFFAQTSSILVSALGEPLITDVAQISSNASDKEEGQNLGALIDNNPTTFWHSDWHGNVKEAHYLQFELHESINDDYLVFYFQRRNVSGEHMVRANILGSEDGDIWEDIATITVPRAEPGAEVTTDPISLPKDKFYKHIRLVNNSLSEDCIYFHLAELEIYHVSKEKVVYNEIYKFYLEYEDYIWENGNGETLNMGTGFGQHRDFDSWKKLYEILQRINTYLETFMSDEYDYNADPNALTLEQIRAMKAEADYLFKQILDSVVPYSIPRNGYYRIYSRLLYYNDTEANDDNWISVDTRRTYVNKAFFASYDANCKEKGMWGTLRKDRANFLWKLTQNGDSIEIQNAGMETYISTATANGEGKIFITEDSAVKSTVMFDWAGKEEIEYADGKKEEKDIFYIRLSSQSRNAGNYFHQAGHNLGKDSGMEQELSLWYGTYGNALYDQDGGTSEWFLEYVPDEEAEALIEAFAPIRERDVLVEMNNTLREKVLEALTKAKDYTMTPIITSTSQLSSPYSDPVEGQNMGALIDGDVNTYWHSDWHGQAPEGEHYLQVSDVEELAGNCLLYVRRRNSGDYHPIELKIVGADNLDIAHEEWEEMAFLTLGNATAGKEYTTPVFRIDSPHKYIRITPTKFTPHYGTNWATAELQFYVATENPNSQFAAMGEVAQALDEVYNTNIAISDDEITIEMYEALHSAYQAFMTALVDPTELRNALVAYEGFTKAIVMGTEPGQWPSMDIAIAFDNLYNEVKAYEESGKYTAEQNNKYVTMLNAMSKSVMEQACKVKTDTWYHIMFPTKEMFTDYGFNPELVGGQSQLSSQPFLWGNYVVPGQKITEVQANDEASTTTHLQAFVTEDIREGVSLFFMDKNEIEDPNTSLFRFVANESTKDYTSSFLEVKENMTMALDMNILYTKGEPLIKEASQLSSNASDQDEGQHIEYLIDGNPGTFWHSDWHGVTREAHYLQVELAEPLSGMIEVGITRRMGTFGGNPVRMYILGSPDAKQWDNVGYLELPYGNMNESIVSLPIDLDGTYKYLRFIPTRRTDINKEFDPFAASEGNKEGSEWTYFFFAEFQIYPVTANKQLSVSEKALQQAYTEANKVLIKNISAENFATASQAYKSYQGKFNAAIGKDVLPNGPEGATPTYAIQNKATGLFINAMGGNNVNNSLELIPTFFDYNAIGYQRSLLHGTNIDGTDCTNLHAQSSDHRLVTWEHGHADSNSGLIIREAEPVESEEFSFYKDIKYGQIYNWCNSVSITNQGDGVAYSCVGYYRTDDGDFLALKEALTIPAGEPAFYIYGDTSYFDEAANDMESMKFTIPAETEIVIEGKTVNGISGSLVKRQLKEHEIYFSGNRAFSVDKQGYNIGANSLVLDIFACPEVDPDGDYDFCICLGEEGKKALDVEHVSTTIGKVSKPGNVYRMDGKLLRTGATLNSLKDLGKGMYIINGIRVLVK